MDTRDKGKFGEFLAATYIEDKGYKILSQNYYKNKGEIDIIALDKNILVFIEVKTRHSKKYGSAALAVDANKQRNIIRTSKLFIHENKMHNIQCRFDVIEVYISDKTNINHITNAFWVE